MSFSELQETEGGGSERLTRTRKSGRIDWDRGLTEGERARSASFSGFLNASSGFKALRSAFGEMACRG